LQKYRKEKKTADRFKTKIKKKRTKANLYLAFVRFFIKEARIFKSVLYLYSVTGTSLIPKRLHVSCFVIV